MKYRKYIIISIQKDMNNPPLRLKFSEIPYSIWKICFLQLYKCLKCKNAIEYYYKCYLALAGWDRSRVLPSRPGPPYRPGRARRGRLPAVVPPSPLRWQQQKAKDGSSPAGEHAPHHRARLLLHRLRESRIVTLDNLRLVCQLILLQVVATPGGTERNVAVPFVFFIIFF